MKKDYLFTPGPTPVPERIMLAMAQPIMHHRKPAFSAILKECFAELKWLYRTANDVLIFASSGTGALEGAVTNFLSPGDRVITVNAGKFGERWTQICNAFGMKVEEIKVEEGKSVSVEAVGEYIKRHKDARAFYIQASETSTGVAHPIKSIAALIKKERPDILVVVDAVTAMGVMDIPTDEWGLDIVVAGSQKALMLPPGLSFASVSEKAWRMNKESKTHRFYFDWAKERKNMAKDTTAFTPAVSLIVGLREALKMLKEEGLDNVFRRHGLLARATREAMKALNLSLFAADAPSNSVTSVSYPNASALIKALKSEFGVTIADGQGELKGKIFRIANLGYYTPIDTIAGVAAIEMGLKKLEHKFEIGAGLAVAQRIIMEEDPDKWSPPQDNYCAL
ncbi:MAG: alanine--glyoxylate aminotransferase family protein [Myxococcota bacterium]